MDTPLRNLDRFRRSCHKWGQRSARRIASLAVPVVLGVGACSDTITVASSAGLAGVSHEPLPPLDEVAFHALGERRIAFWRSGEGGGIYRGGPGGLYVVDGATGAVTGHFGGSWFDWPAVSPDGTELLVTHSTPFPGSVDGFLDGGDLYVLAMDGSNVRRVRAGAAGVYQGPATWAPDGRIVFVEREPGLPRIGIRMGEPVEGGGLGELLHEYIEGAPAHLYRAWREVHPPRPAISVTGRIAIPASHSTLPGSLHLSAPGGPGFELLEVPSEGERSGAIRLDAVAWSPDGGELALLETLLETPLGRHRHQIRVRTLDFDTGTVRLVGAVPTSKVGDPLWHQGRHSICWTPDGYALVFTATAGPFGSDLFLVPAAGGDPVLLVRTGTGDARFDGSVSCLD